MGYAALCLRILPLHELNNGLHNLLRPVNSAQYHCGIHFCPNYKYTIVDSDMIHNGWEFLVLNSAQYHCGTYFCPISKNI